jgi:uridine phosphorylase
MQERHWLIEKAEATAKGAVLTGDPEAVRELAEFLDSFARRHRDKLLTKMKGQKS